MGLNSLLSRLESRFVTLVTAGVTADKIASAASALGRTAVTAATAEYSSIGKTAECPTHHPAMDILPISAYEGDGFLLACIAANCDSPSELAIEELFFDTEAEQNLAPRPNSKVLATVGNDERRYCGQCQNLSVTGLCLAARRGELIAMPTYEPMQDLPHRCEGYVPNEGDEDQRPGWLRWPGLVQTEQLRRKQHDAGLTIPSRLEVSTANTKSA